MPYRKQIFSTGSFYHLLNRSNLDQAIFSPYSEGEEFLETLKYYTQADPPMRLSFFKKMPIKDRPFLDYEARLVTVIAYCVMPNHFHLLVKQEKDKGIELFMTKAQNAFSHYYGAKKGKKGHRFEAPFKAVLVEVEPQLVHLSRYIHLNPVSALLTENPEDYPLSSCNQYLMGSASPPFDFAPVLGLFKNPNGYLDFLKGRKAYQKKLANIKRLLLE